MLHNVDAQRILVVDGLYYAFQRIDVACVTGKERRLALLDAAAHNALHGTARRFRLKTSFLAAMAQNVVVEHVGVSKLACTARLATLQLAVDNDAKAQAPAGIDKQRVARAPHNALCILAVGKGTGVVLDVYTIAEDVGQQSGQGLLGEVV